ncbi:MAG: hypothetical protein AAFV29_01080 [Myxococcota bacterium]
MHSDGAPPKARLAAFVQIFDIIAKSLFPARIEGRTKLGGIVRRGLAWGGAMLVWGAVEVAEARPLTLRGANRAIDLALQAELAGDGPGARQALVNLVQSSTASASTAGRARLNQWLAAMETRAGVWESERSKAQKYSTIIESLAPFGLSRVLLVWDAALVEVPGLRRIRDRQARVALHPDRIVGLDQQMNESLQKQLAMTFGRHGLRIEFPDVGPALPRISSSAPRRPPPVGTYWFDGGPEAPFELRLEVDATGRRSTGRGVEVEARASYILKPTGPVAPVGRFARRRRETRRTEDAARRFAVRHIGHDVAESVVVQMWVECLRQAAAGANAGFDSGSDVRSN